MRKTLLLALVSFSFLVAPSSARAQGAASDSWKITVAPYVFGSGMTGTTAIAGQELDVDMSFGDILSNLQFGAMGLVVARKGNWGIGGDAIWMSLGANATAPGPVGVTGSVDFNEGAFSFYGLRRLNPIADLTFGGRIDTLQGTLRINGLNQRTIDGSKTWFDPVVGVMLHTPAGGSRWHAQVLAEIGGFGVGSTFTWQLFPTVGVDLSKRSSLEFGYRLLDIDYSSGEGLTLFKYDVLAHGPVVGFAFKF